MYASTKANSVNVPLHNYMSNNVVWSHHVSLTSSGSGIITLWLIACYVTPSKRINDHQIKYSFRTFNETLTSNFDSSRNASPICFTIKHKSLRRNVFTYRIGWWRQHLNYGHAFHSTTVTCLMMQPNDIDPIPKPPKFNFRKSHNTFQVILMIQNDKTFRLVFN